MRGAVHVSSGVTDEDRAVPVDLERVVEGRQRLGARDLDVAGWDREEIILLERDRKTPRRGSIELKEGRAEGLARRHEAERVYEHGPGRAGPRDPPRREQEEPTDECRPGSPHEFRGHDV